jgi:hypothetical protein
MKTCDEIVDSMVDEEIATTVEPNSEMEVVNVTPSAEELQRAAEMFVESWRRFRSVADSGDAFPHFFDRWWKELQWLALDDAKLKDLFCGRDRAPASIQRYHSWRIASF